MRSVNVVQYYEYSFIAAICFGLLIQNFLNMRRYGERSQRGHYFRLFIAAMGLCTISEILYGLRESQILPLTDAFGYASEILYTSFIILASYFWYISSEMIQFSTLVATKFRRFLLTLPLIVMIGITVFTPIHHQVFYFEDGHYVRGPLNLVFTLVMGAFIAATGIKALCNSFRKKFYLDRHYFRIVFAYGLVMILFQGIQTLLGPILPFRTIGATLVIYVIQQKYIKGYIYVDHLTGANNRNSANRYLDARFKSSDANLRIAAIDIDHFKKINDEYGHAAGDLALQTIAQAFKSNLPEGVFFARFGGDEFLLADDSGNAERLKTVIQNTKQSLKEAHSLKKLPYKLEFSYGLICKTPDMQTIPDFLAAADAEMYKHKKSRQ